MPAQSGGSTQVGTVSIRLERFFNKIKQCRRAATCYDKLAANYLTFKGYG
jgi:hypothetical protein